MSEPVIKRVDTPPLNGACRGKDLAIFYPYDNYEEIVGDKELMRIARERIALAKSICNDCHVKDPCFAYGVYHEAYGVWGGSSERERVVFRRKHNISRVVREPMSVLTGLNLNTSQGRSDRKAKKAKANEAL